MLGQGVFQFSDDLLFACLLGKIVMHIQISASVVNFLYYYEL